MLQADIHGCTPSLAPPDFYIPRPPHPQLQLFQYQTPPKMPATSPAPQVQQCFVTIYFALNLALVIVGANGGDDCPERPGLANWMVAQGAIIIALSVIQTHGLMTTPAGEKNKSEAVVNLLNIARYC